MADIDKAVELAREHMANSHVRYDAGQCEACVTARAVLAMVAVVEAARAQSAAWDKHMSGLDGPGGAAYHEWERTTNRTEHAVAALDAEARRG